MALKGTLFLVKGGASLEAEGAMPPPFGWSGGQIKTKPDSTVTILSCYNCYNLIKLTSTKLTFLETKTIEHSNEPKIVAISQRYGGLEGGGKSKLSRLSLSRLSPIR